MLEKHHAEYSKFLKSLKEETLQSVAESYIALADTTFWVPNLANASSLIWHAYHSLNIPVNWAGFYLFQNKEEKDILLLGPFQGKVACQTIQRGKGVCGMAAATGKTQLVPDVEKFPGHIACDGETRSEIVVPIKLDDQVIGVLDIDCLDLNGFDETDRKYLESLVSHIAQTNEWLFIN